MSLIKKGKSPYWYYSFRFNGKVYSGSTKTTNRAKAAQIENKRRNEVHAIEEMGDKQPITFEAAMNLYLKTNTNRNNISLCKRLLGSVYTTDKKTILEVAGFDGDMLLHDITSAKLERIVHDRLSRYTPHTIKSELVVLNSIIDTAKRLDYKVPKALTMPKLKIKPTKLRWLTDEEERAVLKELKRYPHVHTFQYDMAILMLDTGCRVGEARELPWSAVDLEARTITLWRPKVRNQTIMRMTNRLHAVLVERHSKKKNGWVFPAKSDKDGHIKQTDGAFKAAFERAGLNDPHIVKQKGGRCSAHIFRKTYASRLVSAGVSMTMVAELLGHSSVTTTERIYGFLAQGVAADAALEVLNDRE